MRKEPRDYVSGEMKGMVRDTNVRKRQLYGIEMQEEEEDTMEEEDQMVQEDEETEENLAHISMHAMNSTVTLSFKMMRVTGHVGTKSINIFIDYESSYNFIHPNVVNKLGLRAQEVAPLSVEVADGVRLTTNQLCSKFS